MIIPNLFYPCLFSLLHSLFWFSSKFSHCFQRELSVKSFPAHTDLVMFSSHVQTKWEPSWTQPPWLSVTSPSLQFSSVIQLCPTLCNPMDCSMPGFPVHHNSWCLLRLMSIESVMPSNHLILCHPLLFPPSIFPASGAFPMSYFFVSGGQSIGVSASASVLPMNIQGQFPLGWTGWIFLQSNGLSRVFFNTTV